MQVEVADTGEGIAPDHERVFELFEQGSSRASRTDGAAGLGLAIARAIVEAHGGRMRVESRPAHGTTFHFTLPFAESRRRWED